MIHFRQDPLITKHFAETGGSFTHTYKGIEYNITPNIVGALNKELVQSISTRLRKLYPPPPPPMRMGRKGKANDSGAPGFDDRKVEVITDEMIIQREIKRLATTEVMVEDKLNYPRVFMKLLSQPHLALEEKRMIPEEKVELYMYVDESTGYNDNDKGFHYTMIQAAKKIKGVKVFHSYMLQFQEGYYWQHMLKHVPRGKTVLVFTQGCGGTNGTPPTGYNIHFCTHFKHGYNCGCSTIRTHEGYSKLFKFHYGLDTPKTLKSLVI